VLDRIAWELSRVRVHDGLRGPRRLRDLKARKGLMGS
jgi:hypothetical protein